MELSPRHLKRHQLQTRKHFWRNYLAHGIEGGIYMGGMGFLAVDSVLPVMVRDLGGADWLISITPVIVAIGFFLPPLLVAHLVERLHRVKMPIMATGVFQRVPYLLAGLALIYVAPTHPQLALAAVVLAPFCSGLAGGCTYSAWLELVAKTVPHNRRSSLWATRNIIGAVIALFAGVVVTQVLRDDPGPSGYGKLHLLTLAFLCVSWLVFGLIKETDLPPRKVTSQGVLGNLRSARAIFASDKHYRRYMVSRMLMSGQFVVLPFMAIHAIDRTGRSSDFAGVLLMASVLGSMAGNLAAGYLGDRRGGKFLSLTASAGMVAAFMASTAAWHEAQFLGIFALLGAARSFDMIGANTLGLELCPIERRPTYLAVAAASTTPSLLAAPVISSACLLAATWMAVNGFTVVATVACVAVAISARLQWKVREPRHAAEQPQRRRKAA